MHLHRRAKIQLAIFSVIALIALAFMALQLHEAARHDVRRRPLHGDGGTTAKPPGSTAAATSPIAASKWAGSIGAASPTPASRRCCR